MEALFSVIIALLFAYSSLHSPKLTVEYTDYIDTLMNSTFNQSDPGAVLLIAKEGKIIFRKAYGMANLELITKLNTESRFPVGELSEQFTSAAIMHLVEQEKISLKEDIRNYLPDYDTHGRTITVENLLTHTSGIPDFTQKPDFQTRFRDALPKSAIVQSFINDSLLFEPGSNWAFSNSNYLLAGLIYEKVSERKLDDYLTLKIFSRLGMMSTDFGSDNKYLPGYIVGYVKDDDKFDPQYSFYWPARFASGGIVTSAEDLFTWDESLNSEKILRKDLTQKSLSPFFLSGGISSNFGYGYRIGIYNGEKVISNEGKISGFYSATIRIPSANLFAAILSNSASLNISKILADIAFRGIGRNILPKEYVYLSGAQLEEFSGIFEVNEFSEKNKAASHGLKAVRSIIVLNDQLFSSLPGGERIKLVPENKDVFVDPLSLTYYKFLRDKSLSITDLEIYTEPVNFGPVEIEKRIYPGK